MAVLLGLFVASRVVTYSYKYGLQFVFCSSVHDEDLSIRSTYDAWNI